MEQLWRNSFPWASFHLGCKFLGNFDYAQQNRGPNWELKQEKAPIFIPSLPKLYVFKLEEESSDKESNLALDEAEGNEPNFFEWGQWRFARAVMIFVLTNLC